MQVLIHKSSELSNPTIAVITEKVNKLETYYDRIERAEVFIKEDDGSAANGHTVEIRLAIPGNDLFATHTDESIERATAEVTEALRRQIRKHKNKHSHQA
ncbi:HPF/RaiA family ribosome-associated protein [Neolewinella litorea]|uniref:Ribosome-associated translation inhibitor RaiA n=1 Tax=Neolewinella litorea TaxID=2562452 RepID=A0A4V3XLE7_9BACT|nr:HPF/RaiA family ribosome-associated protein [Neolewinella litorea]THH40573.1 ribosome-associated translation inhibitor RaiA [Neolewinella litorea]